MLGKSAIISISSAAALVLIGNSTAMAQEKVVYDFPEIYDLPGKEDIALESEHNLLAIRREAPKTSIGKLVNTCKSKMQMQPVQSGDNTYTLSFVLADYIKVARQALDNKLVVADTKRAVYAQKFHTTEREVADTVSNLRAEDEELVPNALYVLIGGLTGTIITRRSNFVVRGATFVVGAGLAMRYFMPNTFYNLTNQVEKYERKVPQVAEARDNVVKAYDSSSGKVQTFVKDARETVRKWTGL